ncbi:MAG: 4-hydroxybenzoate octaprenyltransferase [Caulobacterales bacterium]
MQSTSLPDAAPNNWVDKWAPVWAKPYLRLGRFDRPIGAWLLVLPCWQGLALGRAGMGFGPDEVSLFVLFGIGALAMRGAGCAYNDIVDRDLDKKIARTASRPVASGAISLKNAWRFTLALCGVGLLVLLALPGAAQIAALFSIPLVAIYPFMKRITWWPQVFLGLAFGYGPLIAGPAAEWRLDVWTFCLYGAAILWTIGYDTIYALQDIEDDALVGVRSSARRLGGNVVDGVAAFYGLAVVLAAGAAILKTQEPLSALAVAPFAAHCFWQVKTLKPGDPALALQLFKSNRTAGLLLAAGFAVLTLLLHVTVRDTTLV